MNNSTTIPLSPEMARAQADLYLEMKAERDAQAAEIKRLREAVLASRALLDAMRDANPSITVVVAMAVIAARDAIHAALSPSEGGEP